MNQNEQISVLRQGKKIVMSDKAGATILDGQEVLGGTLIGSVVQNGVAGGRFWLQPCAKPQVLVAPLKRTCIQRHVQVVPVVARWCAVGIPVGFAAHSAGEAAWCTTFQVASA